MAELDTNKGLQKDFTERMKQSYEHILDEEMQSYRD